MELEEAIKILKEDLEHTKKANECGLATKGEFNKEIEAIEFILNHLTKQEKMIEEIKSKLEEHIQHCRQEAQSSLHNEICRISLRFDESLLNIIEKKAKGE